MEMLTGVPDLVVKFQVGEKLVMGYFASGFLALTFQKYCFFPCNPVTVLEVVVIVES